MYICINTCILLSPVQLPRGNTLTNQLRHVRLKRGQHINPQRGRHNVAKQMHAAAARGDGPPPERLRRDLGERVGASVG